MADLYQVITAFNTTIDGGDVEYHVGEIVDADDPGLRKAPAFFGPIDFKHRKAQKKVEQATAAPGEQRGHALTTADLRPKSRG